MSFTGETIIDLFLWFIWWMLLLPLFMVVSTPVILIVALKGETTYIVRVRRKYAGVFEFWRDHAWALSP